MKEKMSIFPIATVIQIINKPPEVQIIKEVLQPKFLRDIKKLIYPKQLSIRIGMAFSLLIEFQCKNGERISRDKSLYYLRFPARIGSYCLW